MLDKKCVNCNSEYLEWGYYDFNIVWEKCYMCRNKRILVSKYLIIALKFKYNKITSL